MNGQSIVGPLGAVIAVKPRERLAELFDRHYDRLYRLARRLSATPDDALDLVQETFLKAAAQKSIPQGFSNEEAWLVRVLVNTQRDHWRKKVVRDRYLRIFGASQVSSREWQNPADTLVNRNTVWTALKELSPRRRAVIIMHELEGLSIPAIATLLGLGSVTVRWHLSQGRRELSLVLKDLYRSKQ